MLLAAAAAVAACALAGAALAADPLPGKLLLGGGSIGPVYRAKAHYDLHSVTVRLLAGGRKAHFYGDLNARCAGFPGPVTAVFDEVVPVAADGSFSGTGPIPGDLAKGTFRFAGRVVADGSAAGSTSATFAFRQTAEAARAYSCRTPQIAWGARATPTGPLGEPRVARGSVYYGNTSQRYPFVLRAPAAGARAVPQATMIWDARCRVQKGGTGGHLVSPPAPLRPDGSFAYTEHFEQQLGDGAVGRYTSAFEGRFGEATAAGTWRVHLDVVGADGRTTDTCDSGVVRWAASL